MQDSKEIFFRDKITQKGIEKYINKYFEDSLTENDAEIIFNLEKLEWINSEEITFLFSWISKLRNINKNLVIKLPVSSFRFPEDNDEIISRRKFIKYYLWSVWGLHQFDKDGIRIINADNINAQIVENARFNFNKRILPFQIIKTQTNANENIDEKLIDLNKDYFKLSSEIINLLNENNCYSPFENKVISEIITKELIMNSVEHAKTSESYFTTSLHNRWRTKSNNVRFKEHFLLEKEDSTLNFYKNKVELLKYIRLELTKIDPSKIRGKREADITKSDNFNIFKNQAFLEFSYIDFGEGIYSTLRDSFLNNREKIQLSLSVSSVDRNIDSQILEYAFLLDSSKDPFDGRIERTDLIPRGLYFLIDMVRRYKGLLVARSGYGKVIYDFSDRIIIENLNNKLSANLERIYIIKDAVVHVDDKNSLFKGTMISIVLPERAKGKFRKSPVRIDDFKLNQYLYNRDNGFDEPIELFRPLRYHYLDFTFLYKASEARIFAELYNAPKGVINAIFIAIDKKLKELNEIGENCILFIDFEYLPRHNYLYKILKYLSNTPLVNEKIKLIAINLDDIDINLLKNEFGFGEEEKTQFLFKAIPCLTISKTSDMEIEVIGMQWIGIGNKDDEMFFTELFEGKRDSIPSEWIANKYLCEGNIIAIFQDRAVPIVRLEEVKKELKNAKLNNIWEWIKNDVIKDGEKISEKYPEKTLYLTSQGAYQTKYISFYEPLNFKFTAEYFAQYLIGKYIDNLIIEFEMISDIHFNNLLEKHQFFIKRSFRFDKILAVTVSSQLLAVEIRNLIRNNKDAYAFFIDYEDQNQNSCIKSFQAILDQLKSANTATNNQLKIFDFFNMNDAIIDCYFDQYHSIRSGKTIELKYCPELIQLSSYFAFEKERPYQKIKENERVLIVNDVISTGSLIKRLIEGIYKKKANVSGVISIADARRKNIDESIESKCYFPEEDFPGIKVLSIISSIKINEFVIRKYLKKPEGFKKIKRINPVLNAIVTLQTKHAEKDKILFDDLHDFLEGVQITDLFKIGHFKQSLSCSGYFIDMHSLFYGDRGLKILHSLKMKMEQKLNKKYEQPFFIFHPIHCGIEEITEETYRDVFKTNIANISTLQRYETPYGWRFAFPPKRFNKLLRGKNILIIDSGSLSGQSLVQLIDAVSIYEVSRIDVLCVIGRLEDFQREFYSKIQQISVKSLQDSNLTRYKNTYANLNLFFGLDLHITSYQSEETCPFCKERSILYKHIIEPSLPNDAKNYIIHRLSEIEISNNDTPGYIPRLKGEEVDFIEIFKMRDELGKIDGYRFYEDYFYSEENSFSFDTLSSIYSIEKIDELFLDKPILQKFELILICVLHEPHLIGCIKDLLRNIYDVLIIIIDYLISSKVKLNQFNYDWKVYSLLRLYYIFNYENEFYKYVSIEKAFLFCEQSNPDSDENVQAYNYLSYLIAKEASKLELNRDPHQIFEILENLKMNFPKDRNNPSRTIINHLIVAYYSKGNEIQSVKESYEKLHTFFSQENAKGGHSDLLNKCSSFDMIRNNPIDGELTFQDHVESLKYIIEKLRKDIYYPLQIIFNDQRIKNCFDIIEYERIFIGNSSVYIKLKEIIDYYQMFETENRDNHTDEKLILLAEKLYDFRIEFLLKDDSTSLQSYSERSIANINKTLKKVISSLGQQIQEIQLSFDNNNLERLINIHESFLNKFLQEVITNSIKHANKDLKDRKAVLQIYTEVNKNSTYDLVFKQDTGFFNPKEINNGTKEIIMSLIDCFFIDEYEITKTPFYTIRIKNNISK